MRSHREKKAPSLQYTFARKENIGCSQFVLRQFDSVQGPWLKWYCRHPSSLLLHFVLPRPRTINRTRTSRKRPSMKRQISECTTWPISVLVELINCEQTAGQRQTFVWCMLGRDVSIDDTRYLCSSSGWKSRWIENSDRVNSTAFKCQSRSTLFCGINSLKIKTINIIMEIKAARKATFMP